MNKQALKFPLPRESEHFHPFPKTLMFLLLNEEVSEKLEQHVRREERVIFPMMEKALPEEVLSKLAPYFHEFHDDEE